MAVNFVIQLLIVRHLAKSEYGAFAYALSMVSLGHSVVTLGLDKGVSRFLAIYDEVGDRSRMAGAITFLFGTMAGLGLIVVAVVNLFQGWLGTHVIEDPQALVLLVVLVALAPAQAVDDGITAIFAVFAKPSSIFFRRYVVAPGLRLGVVLAVVASGAGSRGLAFGYVGASLLGICAYGYLLLGALRSHHLLGWFRRRRMTVPWREILAFTIPLLTTDLLLVVMYTSNVVLLERFHDTAEVASLRVVQPLAGMNQLVSSSFVMLFVPAAARLFARKDRVGLGDLYWRSASWMAVLTFPMFALCIIAAEPLTRLLYGARYAASAPIVVLLSLGYYVNAAFGFNDFTIRVCGRLRILMMVNLTALVTSVGLSLALIPRFGAMGAATGTCVTAIVHNVARQVGLKKASGISTFDTRYLRIYLAIPAAAVVLGLVAVTFHPGLVVGMVLAGAAWLVLIRISRHHLRLAETFPEFLRLPLVGRLATRFLP
jgi:O-antigen/teichoic acid export membrane protein